jgi:flagellar hook-associated protein 1 FlgK
MSLFSTMQMMGGTLQADQIAMQVVGQNISNANTPNYIREDVILTPAPTERQGNLLLGMGVKVEAVVQKIDNFLEGRLRGAVSDAANTTTQQGTYSQLEQLMGELTSTDLSTSLTTFFSSISQILNQPESVSVRNLTVLDGKSLAAMFRQLSTQVTQVRSDVNDQVAATSDEINRLVADIARLNVQIAETEGGDVSNSDAVGLRDQRLADLEGLAKIIDIRTEEQPSGTVTVYVGGQFLVADGNYRSTEVVYDSDRGLAKATVRVAETDTPIEPSGGSLAGLLASRDTILGGYLDELNNVAGTLVFEFNKMFSGGQGLSGYSSVTSESFVTDSTKALNDAGLKFTPVNGSFQVQVYDTTSKTTYKTDIFVNLNGVDANAQTTLDDLTGQLNAITGLTATVGSDGRLTIRSTSSTNQVAFSNDTSGVLAALGINTFFTGSTSADIGVNSQIVADPSKFAASNQGIGANTDNAVQLAQFMDKSLSSQNGQTLGTIYDRMVNDVSQGAAVNESNNTAAIAYEQTLRGQKTATSGVSVDEETVKLIAFQRQFQAAAKVISTINELLELLVKI